MKFVLAIIYSLLLWCYESAAVAKSINEQSKLTCDGHAFTLRTRWQQTSSGHIGWLAQTVQVDGKPVQIGTPHRAVLQGRQTLPEAITGWQCVPGVRQKVVVLSYSCADDDGTGCEGHREWLRLLSATGNSLDRGMTREDPRQNALFDQLGIGAQMDAGLRMQTVIHTD